MNPWFSRPDDARFGDLRAGWRFALFLLLVVGPPFVFSSAVAHFRAHPHAAAAAAAVTPLATALSEGLVFAWVLFVTFLFSRWEGLPLGHYGLPGGQAFGRRFWQGVAWGAIALTVLLLLIFASGGYSFGHLATHGAALYKYAAGWALAFLAVGFFEEFFFRGYVLVTLSGGMGFWPAAILLSLAFGAVHLGNSGESYVGALSAGLIGLFFCFTWRRTGSLWFAVGLHAAWDYCESFVYGVPDSGQVSPGRLLQPSFHGSRWITGGSVGPEGSLWVLLVIALLFVAFARWYPATGILGGPQMPSRRSDASSAA